MTVLHDLAEHLHQLLSHCLVLGAWAVHQVIGETLGGLKIKYK